MGTEDVALAAPGWSARAQDATTVLTNPAGMSYLEGTQILVGLQGLYGNMPCKFRSGTSPGLGTKGGNLVGWFPGGGAHHALPAADDQKTTPTDRLSQLIEPPSTGT